MITHFPLRGSSSPRVRILWLVGLIISMLVAGCGGGGGGGSVATPNAGSSFAPSQNLANLCANPRTNTTERQGTVANEKAYLRSFIDETYLWYRDVPTNLVEANYLTAPAYFDVLKTNAITASGAPLDQFHWSQTTASWQAQQAGQASDYGIDWAALASRPPRNWLVTVVAPNSPAALAGVKRGDKLTSIDGVDFVNDNTQANVDILNAALFPTNSAVHSFGFNNAPALAMSPALYQVITVQNVKTIPTATGTVGYFTFDSQIAQSEQELIDAVNQLKAAQINDLVIDLRYNGGGLLYIASELAYMIAGPNATGGKFFEQLQFNDKQSAYNVSYPFAFHGNMPAAALPHLDLRHVTLLVTHSTASASESVINSLRGIDISVDLMGTNTRGKPYGFYPQDNCGYTYFAIQFKGVNNKGFGDYADGFAPTCVVADDYSHARGDSAEGLLRTALSYRLTGVCPVNPSAQVLQASSPGGIGVTPPTRSELRLLNKPPR